MSDLTKTNFVRQQGFVDVDEVSARYRFPALMFQPRLIGVVAAVGLITQSGSLFLVLGILLAWSALVPRWSPFDALYNVLVARPRGLQPLSAAPPPRRVSQALSGVFSLAIGLALLAGNKLLALILEGFFVAALLALLVGRFCLGSYLYHFFRRWPLRGPTS